MTLAPIFALPGLLWRLAGAPAEWANVQIQHLARAQRSLVATAGWPSPQRADGAQQALGDLLQGALALPFDALRAQHAAAVQAGALPRSLLESKCFEQHLGQAERLMLGPLARSV